MEPQEQPDVDMEKTEQPQTDVPKEGQEGATEGEHKPQGKPISDLVNQEFASTIKEMGFSKAVAEKSLLYTNNQSVEAAMDWITQHQEDADFEQEELLADDFSTEDPNKPKLSKEERIQAALELQRKIRAKREAEDKRMAEEQEKQRIQSTKELQKAKKKMDEQQAKLRMELERKEKMEYLKEKKRMEELLRKVSHILKIFKIRTILFLTLCTSKHQIVQSQVANF
jgi:hypothetical protein